MEGVNEKTTGREICGTCGAEYPSGTGICPDDHTELVRIMADPMIGVVLPRRYRILSLLGRGAMSVVYKGTYEPLDQLVAIKMLKSHLVSDPSQFKRFQQEIKTAGGLEHPNIVGILDFGVTEQGVPYLIMEYLQGHSLSDLMHKEERLSVNRAVRLFSQAADALAYAHREKGLVHRDIKPSNIIIVKNEDDEEVIKVVDFGIAKIQGNVNTGANLHLTATGEVLGTPLYMSPEQSMGKELDGRSDIYALGCVLYEVVTGRPPFVGDNAIETIRKQITTAAPSVDDVRPDLYIPERLKAVINKCLVKDRKYRYQRMEDLKRDLEAVNKRSESAAMPSTAAPSEEQEPAPSAPEPQNQPLSFTSRKVIGSVIVGAILLQVGIAIYLNYKPTTPSTAKNSEPAPTAVPSKPSPVQIATNPPAPVAKSGAVDEKQWQTLCQQAESALHESRLEDAETNYRLAVKEAEAFPQPDSRLADTLMHLSTVYYQEDRYKAAEVACTRSLNIRLKVNPNDPGIADNLSNLSLIASAMGTDQLALELCKQALDVRKKALGLNHHDVALSYKALAELECKKGNYKKARELLNQAVTISEKALGKDDPGVAGVLQALAMVYEKEKNYPKAEEMFNRALGIRQAQLGLEHPEVADTLLALGTLNFNRKRDHEAETMFKQALDIRKKALGEDNSKTAEVITCLGILYDADKKYDQAEDCFRQALTIREKIWGEDSPKLLRTLNYLAKFLRQQNKVKAAELYEAKIKRIETAAKAEG